MPRWSLAALALMATSSPLAAQTAPKPKLIVAIAVDQLSSDVFSEYRPRFTGGFNLVGIGCVILSCLITILFVYNPLTGSIQSPLFLIFTGSGFDAICGGLLYWLASRTPLKKYMLRVRDDLEIV